MQNNNKRNEKKPEQNEKRNELLNEYNNYDPIEQERISKEIAEAIRTTIFYCNSG